MLLVATCNSSYFILQTGVYGTTSISDSKAKGTCGQPVNPESILHLPTLKQATHLTSLWPHENSRPSRATKMDAKHHPTNDTNGSSWSIWEIWWSKKQFDCPVPLVPYNMVAKLHQLNTHTPCLKPGKNIFGWLTKIQRLNGCCMDDRKPSLRKSSTQIWGLCVALHQTMSQPLKYAESI